jgi:tRNA dimethylallyltransferase
MLDGTVDEAAARQATVVATRRFARRQRSWFGRDERIRWLPADVPDLVERAVSQVGATLTGAGP